MILIRKAVTQEPRLLKESLKEHLVIFLRYPKFLKYPIIYLILKNQKINLKIFQN
jgi:hypothetical protein